MPKNDLKKSVAYIRMSSDKQDDSPERQKIEIEKYASENGYEINSWYEDHGLTGTKSKNRPSFQQLLADAKHGSFHYVVMYEQSRFSREDMLQFSNHLYKLRECGVSLVTCRKGVIDTDDLSGMLLAYLDSYTSRSESINIGERSASGKRKKLQEGITFPKVLFGFDRLFLDRNGSVTRRVHFREKAQRQKGESTQLIPSSDLEAVNAVKEAFQNILDGKSTRSIALRFNERGIKTARGKPWIITSVKRMLRNPAYYGTLRVGYQSKGQFASIYDSPKLIENHHEGIVSKETFDAVQEILATRKGRRQPSVDGRYLLTSLMQCGHCGSRVGGVLQTYGEINGWTRSPEIYYRCMNPENCGQDVRTHISIKGEFLENTVIDVLKDKLFSDENLTLADQAQREQLLSENTDYEADRAAELRQKISIASERMASDLFNEEEISSIIRTRRKWMEELRHLNNHRSSSVAIPKSSNLAELQEWSANIQIAPRPMLRDFVQNYCRLNYSLEVEPIGVQSLN